MIRRAFGQVGHVAVPKDEEYLALVRDILENEQVRSMDGYFQHGHTTCLRHSIHVSYLSYLFCKKHGLDARAAARGGLLHDLFLYDWHFYRRRKGERLHGFEHPKKRWPTPAPCSALPGKSARLFCATCGRLPSPRRAAARHM